MNPTIQDQKQALMQSMRLLSKMNKLNSKITEDLLRDDYYAWEDILYDIEMYWNKVRRILTDNGFQISGPRLEPYYVVVSYERDEDVRTYVTERTTEYLFDEHASRDCRARAIRQAKHCISRILSRQRRNLPVDRLKLTLAEELESLMDVQSYNEPWGDSVFQTVPFDTRQEAEAALQECHAEAMQSCHSHQDGGFDD